MHLKPLWPRPHLPVYQPRKRYSVFPVAQAPDPGVTVTCSLPLPHTPYIPRPILSTSNIYRKPSRASPRDLRPPGAEPAPIPSWPPGVCHAPVTRLPAKPGPRGSDESGLLAPLVSCPRDSARHSSLSTSLCSDSGQWAAPPPAPTSTRRTLSFLPGSAPTSPARRGLPRARGGTAPTAWPTPAATLCFFHSAFICLLSVLTRKFHETMVSSVLFTAYPWCQEPGLDLSPTDKLWGCERF